MSEEVLFSTKDSIAEMCIPTTIQPVPTHDMNILERFSPDPETSKLNVESLFIIGLEINVPYPSQSDKLYKLTRTFSAEEQIKPEADFNRIISIVVPLNENSDEDIIVKDTLIGVFNPETNILNVKSEKGYITGIMLNGKIVFIEPLEINVEGVVDMEEEKVETVVEVTGGETCVPSTDTAEVLTEEHRKEIMDKLMITDFKEATPEEYAAMNEEERAQYNLTKFNMQNKTYHGVIEAMTARGYVNAFENQAKVVIDRIKRISSDDRLAIIEARLKDIPMETLKNVNTTKPEEYKIIEDLYQIEEGEEIKFNLPLQDKNDARFKMFKKDFLLYLKQSAEDFDKIEEEIKAYQTIIAEYDEEIKEIVGKYDNINDFMYNNIKEQSENELFPENQRQILKNMLQAWDDSYSVKYIIDDLKKFINEKGSAKSILGGHKMGFLAMVEKTDKIMKTKFPKYNLNLGLQVYADLEVKFLPEQYHTYNNLFLFIVMRYIKYNYEKFTYLDLIFLTQIFFNIKTLHSEEEGHMEKKNIFLNSVLDTLNLVIQK